MKSISLYRLNGIFLLGILFFTTLYFGREFFVPLALAIILVMLMLPVCNTLEHWGFSRFWASICCLLIILLVMAGLILILTAQAASFTEDLPLIQQKLHELTNQLQAWIALKFGLGPQKQVELLKIQIEKFSASANRYLTTFLQGTFSFLTAFTLMLLYVLLLLWQREKYEQFILRLIASEDQEEARKTLLQITKVAGQYFSGRLISMLFVTVFYSIALSMLGLKNAVIVSIIAVIPNLIPYVGAFFGGFFPLIMVLISGSTGIFIPTVIILIAAQVIDNNFIEPLVMGAQLKISPIMTIFAIVIGEMIWGIPGMIIFQPLFSIIRIVCSHIPALDPYSYVMSDDSNNPGQAAWIVRLKKKFWPPK